MLIPTTIDSFIDGSLVLEQPAPGFGYRVSVDSILLAKFAIPFVQHDSTVIDLGSGVGAVALALSTIIGARQLILVESQPLLAGIALRNVRRAGATTHARVVESDIATWALGANTSLQSQHVVVVANPPYTPIGSGRRSAVACVDAAKHGSLTPFFEAASHLLATASDTACMCYPASAIVDFLATAHRYNLQASRLQFVYAHRDSPARIALVTLRTTRGTNLNCANDLSGFVDSAFWNVVIEPGLLDKTTRAHQRVDPA